MTAMGWPSSSFFEGGSDSEIRCVYPPHGTVLIRGDGINAAPIL